MKLVETAKFKRLRKRIKETQDKAALKPTFRRLRRAIIRIFILYKSIVISKIAY